MCYIGSRLGVGGGNTNTRAGENCKVTQMFLRACTGTYAKRFVSCSAIYLFKYSFAVSTGNFAVLKSFLFRVIMISNLFSNAV